MSTRTAPSLDRDYAAITGGAGVIDRSARGKVDVTGADAADYLQGQVTNDVLALSAGQGCYAALLDPKAHIAADMRILSAGPADVWLDTEPDSLDTVLAHLRMYKIGRQVEVADRTAERALLSLLGPASADVAARLAGVRPPEAEHAWLEAAVAGTEVRLVVTGAGVDLLAPVSARDALWSAVLEAGAAEVGAAAAEVLRVERGIPRHGVDMGPENLPGEAGIVERAVSFTKGCYIGQEPVARMYHRGRPNRSLRGLRLETAIPAGEPLFAGEREVGRLTSAVESPRLGPIGLAIVRREVASGDRLTAGGPAGAGATVVELPFGTP
jgi:tRNA-modifying protein YgfZ